jgi:hypothetical protein
MGLGIACLTLVLSGVTRAGQINIGDGNQGKNDKCYTEDKGCSDKGVTLDLGKDDKDLCKKLEKDICKDIQKLEELKDCKHDKGDKGKDHCKIEWKNCDKHDFCFDDKDKHDHCDIVVDRGCHEDHCQPHGCDPIAVPTPASSAMSGAGLLGIALMAFARSRRSINA